MQVLSLRGLHVHYSVREPNSCFKNLFPTFWYNATEKENFVSNFRVRSSVDLYAVA